MPRAGWPRLPSTAPVPCSVIFAGRDREGPGDIDGVCTDPVSAQEMMVFLARFTLSVLVSDVLPIHGPGAGRDSRADCYHLSTWRTVSSGSRGRGP